MKYQILATLLALTTLTYLGYQNKESLSQLSLSSSIPFLSHGKQTLFGLESCKSTCTYQCETGDRTCLLAANYYYNEQYSNKQCLDFWNYNDHHDAYAVVPESWYLCQQQSKPEELGNFAKRYNCIVKCGN